MRIACLQFDPKLGELAANIQHADAILARETPTDLDLLVLPEMAFTGYNFKSLPEILPHLEPTAAGPSTDWAVSTARRLGCHVIVGYPETFSPTQHYNSAVLVSPAGNILTNYRKHFLFTTDKSWALPGPSGFYTTNIPTIGRTAIGICMDLNPHEFTAPFEDYEFGTHVVASNATLAVVPMAWLTEQSGGEPSRPDRMTQEYWASRMRPAMNRADGSETLLVTCNRVGVEDDVVFAGSSAVMGFVDGRVRVYACLGRGEEALLVCDVGGSV